MGNSAPLEMANCLVLCAEKGSEAEFRLGAGGETSWLKNNYIQFSLWFVLSIIISIFFHELSAHRLNNLPEIHGEPRT